MDFLCSFPGWQSNCHFRRNPRAVANSALNSRASHRPETIVRSSRGVFRHDRGASRSNMIKQDGRSIRCCVPNASTKCALCRSSMTRRSLSASCGMLACGWMRFAIMAFASRQARGRRQRKQSSAANLSSNYALTIRCRTMTAGSDCGFRVRSVALQQL